MYNYFAKLTPKKKKKIKQKHKTNPHRRFTLPSKCHKCHRNAYSFKLYRRQRSGCFSHSLSLSLSLSLSCGPVTLGKESSNRFASSPNHFLCHSVLRKKLKFSTFSLPSLLRTWSARPSGRKQAWIYQIANLSVAARKKNCTTNNCPSVEGTKGFKVRGARGRERTEKQTKQ